MTNTKTTLYRLQWKDYSLNLYFNPNARTKRIIDTYYTYRNALNLKDYSHELNLVVKPYRLDRPGRLLALKDHYVIKEEAGVKEKSYLPEFIHKTFQSSYCFWESDEDINGGISEANLKFYNARVRNRLPYRKVYDSDIELSHYDLDIPKGLDTKGTRVYINYSGRTNMVQIRLRKFCNDINANLFMDTCVPYTKVMHSNEVDRKLLKVIVSGLCGRLVDQLRYYSHHPDTSKTYRDAIIETIDIEEIISMSE